MGQGKRWTDQEKSEALRLKYQGLSDRDIEARTGIGKSTISRWMSSDNLAASSKESQSRSLLPNEGPPMAQTIGGLADVMTELMPEELSEVLEEHVVATGQMVRSTATVLSSGHLLSKAIALIDLDEAAIERAIMAQVPERDSEGNTYMVDPGEWTQYQRRAFIHDTLTKAQNQSAKMLAMAIRLQREAHGLDFSQELTSALARVMAAGFTVVR